MSEDTTEETALTSEVIIVVAQDRGQGDDSRQFTWHYDVVTTESASLRLVAPWMPMSLAAYRPGSHPKISRHGGPESFTFENHDPRGGCVLLNNGTVKFIRTEEELLALRWQ